MRTTMTRPSWDDYFLGIAGAVAARADCTRRQVGAAVVDTQRRIASTGYNGAPSQGGSCLAGDCPRGALDAVAPGSSYDTDAGACIALHAEQNALLWADPARLRGGTIYITDAPCNGCLRMLKGSGLAHVIWPGGDILLLTPEDQLQS